MPIYMQYGSIKGTSTDNAHAGWIEVDSLEYGPVGAQGGQVREIVITRAHDSTSPLLMQESVSGRPVKVVFNLVKQAGGSNYLELTLTDAMISSYKLTGGAKPTETISINFAKIEYNYTKPDDVTGTPDRP